MSFWIFISLMNKGGFTQDTEFILYSSWNTRKCISLNGELTSVNTLQIYLKICVYVLSSSPLYCVLRKILEEAMMVLKEQQKSVGTYLEYCSMQISSFAKPELCTATSIQFVEQWTSIQMLWRERGKMLLINEAVKGVNACWEEPAWVIYCAQILCKRIPSNSYFRKKGMELMWPVCVKCNPLRIQN